MASQPSSDIVNLLVQHITSEQHKDDDRGLFKKDKHNKKAKKDKKHKPPKKGKLNVFHALTSNPNLRHTILKILGGAVLVGGVAAAGVAIHHYYNSTSGQQQQGRPGPAATVGGPAAGYGQPPANYGYGYGSQGPTAPNAQPMGALGAPPQHAPPQHNLVYGQEQPAPQQYAAPVYGSGGGGSVSQHPAGQWDPASAPQQGQGGQGLVYGSASHGSVPRDNNNYANLNYPSSPPQLQQQQPSPIHDPANNTIRVDPADDTPATITLIANDPRVKTALEMLSQQGFKVKGREGFSTRGKPSSMTSSSSSSDSDSD